MRDSLGRVALVLREGRFLPQRAGQWLPRRVTWLTYRRGRRWYEAMWDPWRGLLAVGSGAVGSHQTDTKYLDPLELMVGIKKRDVLTGGSMARPALAFECVLFKRFPAIAEFLSATVYEDGSPRTPGYAWMTNRVVAYELTIFDPDGCCKLPCLGKTWDEAYALAETHLRSDNAPWQPDPYLAERKQGKKKK